MYRELTLAPPEVCLEIYYSTSTGEIGNAEIERLFNGKISRCTIRRFKNNALKEMTERGITHFDACKVNADILFKQLGLDIERLKRHNKELKKLKTV